MEVEEGGGEKDRDDIARECFKTFYGNVELKPDIVICGKHYIVCKHLKVSLFTVIL